MAAEACHLTREPIDGAELLRLIVDPQAGAEVLFLGVTRGDTGGVRTRWLDYEAYELLARRQLAELEVEGRGRHGLTGCRIMHRLGRVPVGEASVAVAVAAPHRREAFVAAEWLMDRIKKEVAIWKCEELADGSRSWVHPEAGAGDVAGMSGGGREA